jgi:hypothetical protein
MILQLSRIQPIREPESFGLEMTASLTFLGVSAD